MSAVRGVWRRQETGPAVRAAARAPGSGRNGRIGARGEQEAARYLAGRGYVLLDRNWRSARPGQRGELDLVLRHRGALVVCEVKTRTGPRLAHPAEAVTPEKAARLRRLAVLWLREHAGARPGSPFAAHRPRPFVPTRVRIDVVAVRLGPREPYPLLGLDHLRAVA